MNKWVFQKIPQVVRLPLTRLRDVREAVPQGLFCVVPCANGIYGISFDRNGDEAKWQKFIADNKMTWVNVWGIDSEGKWSIGEAYNVSSIPANFLFSPEGKLVAKNLRGDDVKKILAEHIK